MNRDALGYHEAGRPGKLAIRPTKPLANQRDRFLPGARLTERANILVFPGMDAANAAIDALTSPGNAQPIGPVLLGYNGAAHIVAPAVTVRGLLNVAAIASTSE